MKLLDAVKKVPLLRPNAIPNSHNLAIVCHSSAFPHIYDFLLEKAQAIFIIEDMQDLPKEKTTKDGSRRVKVFPLTDLADKIYFDIVYFHHEYEYGPFCSCIYYLRRVGFESFYTFMPAPYNCGITTTHIPNYFSSNKSDLEYVYDLLADEESKNTFAARIRAIETGNVGYVKVSDFPEYFHPVVKPMPGDFIIDGGVSGSVNAQIQFVQAIGKEGKIFGFEPDPLGFCEATEALKERGSHENYKLIPLGLWSKKDFLFFEIAGQGTHACKDKTDCSVRCEVISVDEFCKHNYLRKVDFIKLDVEGSESDAIKGSIQTITKFRPKLAICLYHTPRDLYYLPKFISTIVPDYKFYIGHHHASLHETVLYATP